MTWSKCTIPGCRRIVFARTSAVARVATAALFLNSCIGCHSGMDPMAGAFAYYNYDENSNQLVYDDTAVHSKYFNNDLNFPQGYITTDDSWQNRWREGPERVSRLRPGRVLAVRQWRQGHSAWSLPAARHLLPARFAKCFARSACATPKPWVIGMRSSAIMNTFFVGGGYSMKHVFADSAVHCMGP